MHNGNATTQLWKALDLPSHASVRKALAFGADPNDPRHGMPPLIHVVRTLGQSEQLSALPIIDELLASGADPDATDRYGCTALSYTLVRRRNLEPVGLAEPCPRDQRGGRAFENCIQIGLNLETRWDFHAADKIIVRLLEHGASLAVPLGYVLPAEVDTILPDGMPRLRAVGVAVFSTVLFLVGDCADPAPVDEKWSRVFAVGSCLPRQDLERPDVNLQTPLCHALMAANPAAIAYFLRRGVSTRLPSVPKGEPPMGFTALIDGLTEVEELANALATCGRTDIGLAFRQAKARVAATALGRAVLAVAADPPRARL